MELPVKLSGIVLILIATTFSGFFMSLKLRQRYRKLVFIYRSMSDLKERIKVGSGEIDRLINLSFKDGLVKTETGFKIDENGLTKQDLALLGEFFDNIGMSEATSECERIGLYMSLFSSKCDEAQKKCSELCRLYAASGFLCGIFICIFFL